MGIFNRKKKVDEEAVDPDARSPQLGLKYQDLAVMGQLLDHGADLDQPRHVVHFLYFDSKGAAAAAADELASQGWVSEVRAPLPDYPDQWSLVCEQHDVVLLPDFIRESTNLFGAVAAQHGGSYDGWEASV
jgi:hypothetical protein